MLWGLGLQFGFAVLVLKTSFGKVFQAASVAVTAMLGYAEAGSAFVFGDTLGRSSGSLGTIFAFQVLPIIIFIASFFSILYYLGDHAVGREGLRHRHAEDDGRQRRRIAERRRQHFMGQTEAPLTIRPFLAGLTESELFTIMVSGMAHVSGAVMAAYVKIAHVEIQHLLTAVIMTAPATIMLAKIIEPEVGMPVTAGKVEVKLEKTAVNVIDAAAQGAGDGLQLVPQHSRHADCVPRPDRLVNGIFGWVHGFVAWFPARCSSLFGIIFAPVAWLLGVSWKDCRAIGSCSANGWSLNEFIAFIDLGKIKDQLDPHSFTIATYALCGFANFSSIAIQVGGIGALAPSRKSDLARLGLRAVAAGTMANFMSACIAGMLL